MYDHTCRTRANCVAYLEIPVKAVNVAAQLVAPFNVALFCNADIVTGKLGIGLGSLQQRQGFAGDKPELRVETKRAIVVARLYQTNPCGFFCRCPIEYGTHQASADSVILHFRSDRDRADPKNSRAFVHEVAADNRPGLFRDHAVESWIAN